MGCKTCRNARAVLRSQGVYVGKGRTGPLVQPERVDPDSLLRKF